MKLVKVNLDKDDFQYLCIAAKGDVSIYGEVELPANLADGLAKAHKKLGNIEQAIRDYMEQHYGRNV